METRVSKLLGTKYPVIQGGMAWVAEYHLAAAVSNAGGLGIIGAASAPPEVVREQIREAKKLTDKPFGVNVMLLNPNAAEVAQIVIEEGVKVVTTGAGNPGKFMDAWKQAGVVVIPVVASVAMARMMERGGADAVIAEGMESGGHIGAQTTMTLVPQVADAVQIPVIAAGGIADGRGMAAAFMLGAEGVQMGTRFVVAKESIVHPNYKERVIKAKDIDSEVTGMSTGHPIRVLRNQMSREYLKMEKEANPFLGYRAIRLCLDNPEIFKPQIRALLRASAYGNIAIMFPMISSIEELRRAKAVVEECKKELDNEGKEYKKDIKTGIMVEIPSTAIMAEEFGKECDFFSIGTNDLTQYTLAVDRQNPKLDRFFDPHHPAILAMIRMVVENAHKAGIWAGICGELGADTSLTKEFLAMGVDELSVSAGSILPIRKIILETDLSQYGKDIK